MSSLSVRIERNRVIEINNHGRFYVLGAPTFVVCHVPDYIQPARSGYIIIEDIAATNGYQKNLHSYNAICKMSNDGKLFPCLFKNPETAEEVCFAVNRMRLDRPPVIQV